MASGKGAGSTKSTNFGLLWGSLHFSGPRSRKSRKSAGALEMAYGKGADSTKSTNFGLLWVPSISAVPEAGNPGKSTEALEMASGKGADSTKSTNFVRLWGSFHFGGNPEIQEIHRGLRNGFQKRSGLYKIDKFWAFVVFPHFGGPIARKSAGALEMASGKGADSAK